MPTRASFSIGLKIAIEDSYSIAPPATTNGEWFQGGRWLQITTEGMPDIWDRQAVIFGSGQAGRRAMNVRRPIAGRRWSDGSFSFDVVNDFFPALVYGALGSISSNSVPAGDASVMQTNEPLSANALKSLVLTNQPNDGGNILMFTITDTSMGGSIGLSGVDVNGNGASEVISFSSAGSMFSRTSFSSIGASSVQVWMNNQGSVTINGFQYFEHTISIDNTSNPSFSVERHGDPTAGNTSITRLIPGMVVQEFTLNTPADQRDGLVTGSVTLEGNPTATCTGTSLTSVSTLNLLPAWTLSFTRDGTAYNDIINFAMTFTAGNRNYRSAAGIQGPQGAVYLGQELTGAFDLLLSSEDEYNRWYGTSQNNLVATWTAPYYLTSAIQEIMIASLTQIFYEEVDDDDSDGLQILSVDFRSVEDANNGLMKMFFRNRTPPPAYSGASAQID